MNYSKANSSSPWAYPSLHEVHQRAAPDFTRFSDMPIPYCLAVVFQCITIHLHCCCAKSGPESPDAKHFQCRNASLQLIYCVEEQQFLSASYSTGSKTQSPQEARFQSSHVYLMRSMRHTMSAIKQWNSGECQVLLQTIYDDITLG